MNGKLIVTATHAGHYETYREPGAVFEIDPARFSSRWMVKGDKRPAEAPVNAGRKTRQETLAAGGAAAALDVALEDLKEAKAELAERDAKIAALEAKLADVLGPVQDAAPDVDPDTAPEEPGDTALEEPGGTAPEEPSGTAPPGVAPVQRVRRTAT